MKRDVIKVPMWTNPILSRAVRAGDLIFTAGQVAIDPHTGEAVGGDIKAQASQVLDNLKFIPGATGTSLDNTTAKANIYLQDWDDFEAFNGCIRHISREIRLRGLRPKLGDWGQGT